MKTPRLFLLLFAVLLLPLNLPAVEPTPADTNLTARLTQITRQKNLTRQAVLKAFTPQQDPVDKSLTYTQTAPLTYRAEDPDPVPYSAGFDLALLGRTEYSQAAPAFLVLHFTVHSYQGRGPLFDKARNCSLRADTRLLELGEQTIHTDYAGDTTIERVNVLIPFADFAQIAQAKELFIRLGPVVKQVPPAARQNWMHLYNLYALQSAETRILAPAP